MHYYYSGVTSWGWFYNHHYAPRISGTLSLLPLVQLTTLQTSKLDLMQFEFELGTLFKPFEQLMGVLPAASTEQVPRHTGWVFSRCVRLTYS